MVICMKKCLSLLLTIALLIVACANIALAEGTSVSVPKAPNAEEPIKRPVAEGDSASFQAEMQNGSVGYYFEGIETWKGNRDLYVLMFDENGKLVQVGYQIVFKEEHPELDYAIERLEVPTYGHMLAFYYTETENANQALYDVYNSALGDQEASHVMTDVSEKDFRLLMGDRGFFSIYEGEIPQEHILTFSEETFAYAIAHPDPDLASFKDYRPGESWLVQRQDIIWNPYPGIQRMHAELLRGVPSGKLSSITLSFFCDTRVVPDQHLLYPDEDISVYATKDGETYTKVGDFKLNPVTSAQGCVTTLLSFPETEAIGIKVVLTCKDGPILVTQYAVSGDDTRDNPTEPILGDLNGNGGVDANDCFKLRRAFFGLISLSEEEIALVDFNGNGVVDANDCFKLRRAFFGLLSLQRPN